LKYRQQAVRINENYRHINEEFSLHDELLRYCAKSCSRNCFSPSATDLTNWRDLAYAADSWGAAIGKVASMNMKTQFLHFEDTGYLKSGVHSCTLEMLQTLTFTNPHRRSLGDKLLKFLKWPYEAKTFMNAYIGGGFVSDRPFPVDVDLVLETKSPFGPEAFAAIEPFFLGGLDKILGEYSVHLHFWMENAPKSVLDYRSFFQYERPTRKSTFNLEGKGILRLSLVSEEVAQKMESLELFQWSQRDDERNISPETSQPMAA